MFYHVLGCQNLPTLPTIAMELLEKTRDPDVSMKEIARLVQSDVGLASRILRTVNSSFFGLSKPCNSIDRALNYLGLKAVKSLVLGFSMVNFSRCMKDRDFDLGTYWRRTILSATAARLLAVSTRACDADEAFTAGLFQDMGILALFIAIPEQYAPVLAGAPECHTRFAAHEAASLGFNHAQVGAALAEKWKMPANLVAGIRFHHDPDSADPRFLPIVRTIALGGIAADTMIVPQPGKSLAELKTRAAAWFHCEGDEVESLLERVNVAARELADLLDQNIGQLPEPQEILARANQQLIESQITTQREAVELERRAAELQTQTMTDALTGIANRKRFDALVAESFRNAAAGNNPLAILFADADKFKPVNDTYGHQAGDLVLIDLARRMKQTVGAAGEVCRYGGEEFAVVLPGCAASQAAAIAERIRQTIASTPFDLSAVEGAPRALKVTVSVGVAAWEPDAGQPLDSIEQLVQQADQAVYDAKHAGRNRVRVYGDQPASASIPTQGAFPLLLLQRDPLTANILRQAFIAAGAREITTAQSLGDARKRLSQWRPQESAAPGGLVITEWRLPDGDASALLQMLSTPPWGDAWRVVTLLDDDAQHEQARRACPQATGLFRKQEIASDLAAWAAARWVEFLQGLRTSQAA